MHFLKLRIFCAIRFGTVSTLDMSTAGFLFIYLHSSDPKRWENLLDIEQVK